MIPATFTYIALMMLELSNPYRDYCYDSEMVLCENSIYTYSVGGPGSHYTRYEYFHRAYWGDSSWPDWFDFYILLPAGELIDSATITRGRKYWIDEQAIVSPMHSPSRKTHTLWRLKIRNDKANLDRDQPIRLRIESSHIIPKTKKVMDEEGKVIEVWRETPDGVMIKEEGA